MSNAKFWSMVATNFAVAALAAAAVDSPPPPAAPAGASGSSAAGESPAPQAPREAQIPFASKGGIWNWRVVDNNTVLIESRGRKWYKATLFGNCINLAFANSLSFIPNPSGSFDKFSTIRSHGQRCPLVSLIEVPAPPKKPNPKNVAPATPHSSPQ
jgi:Family of unknown function (DUF6491)